MISLITGRAADWLFARALDKIFTPGLWRRIEATTTVWAKGLPQDLYVRPAAMIPPRYVANDAAGVPELSRLHQHLLGGSIPPIDLWDNVLKEHWLTKRRLKGELQPFFAADFELIAPHIRDLASALFRICAEDPKRFQMEMLGRTESLPQSSLSGELVDEHSRWNQRIDEGKKLAIDEKWTAALELFRQIEAEAATEKLRDPKVWYRLNTNIGSSLLALGQEDAARPYLLRALDYQEEDPIALGQLAQLEMLSNNFDRAVGYARRVIVHEPNSEIAWCALIQSDSREFTNEDLPEPLRDSQTIFVALGSTALRRGDSSKALAYLREAVRRGGREPQALLVLAETLLLHHSSEAPFRGYTTEVREEIIRLSTEAIELLGRRDQPHMLSRAFFVRGVALESVGDSRATHDLQRADQLGHDSPGPKHSLARALLKQGKPEAALFFLDQIPRGEHETKIQSLRARVLNALGRKDDVEAAIRAALAAGGPTPDSSLIFDIVDTALEAEQLSLAEELLTYIPVGQGGFYEVVLQARLKYARKEIDSAMHLYEKAVGMAITEEDRTDIAFECAMHFLKEEMPEKASEYFELSDAQKRGGTALRGLMHSLLATGKVARAASLLEDFATIEEMPDWALEMASHIALQRDDMPVAAAVLERLVDLQPGDSNARIHLAYVLLRSGDNRRAEEILSPLTESSEVSAHNLARAAQLYSNAGHSNVALALAYKAIRQEPDNPELKRIYIKFFLERDATDEFAPPVEVGADSYVKLTELRGSRELEYYIVSDKPRSGRVPELALSDEIAERLLGKRLGEELTFHVNTLAETKYRISEVKNGFVHTFQTILAMFPSQHPEFKRIQMLRIDETKPLDPFTPLFLSVDQKAAEAEEILELYRSRVLPLGFVAQRGGVSLQEAYNTLAHHPSHRLLVQDGDHAVMARSLGAANTAQQVVVTLSGMLTLHRLDRLDLLLSVGRTLLAPQSLLDDINDALRELALTEKRGGVKVLAKMGEGYQMIESGREQIHHAIAELNAVLDFVRSNVEIRPRPFTSLSQTDEDLREAITASDYDAHALSGPDTALFADDLGLQNLASAGRGAGYFSTSILLQSMHAQGVLSRVDLHRDLIKLIEMNHFFIALSADIVYDALVAEAFQFSPLILKVLDRLSTTEVNFAPAAQVGAGLLKKLAMSPLGGGIVEPVATLLFERLTRGVETKLALNAFNEVLQNTFSLLPREYERIRDRMDIFLASKRDV